MTISIQHALAKSPLVKALANCRCDVSASRRVVLTHEAVTFTLIDTEPRVDSIVHSYREKQLHRIVFDYENRPCRQVLAWNDTVKVNERKPVFHGKAQPSIVGMVLVCTR